MVQYIVREWELERWVEVGRRRTRRGGRECLQEDFLLTSRWAETVDWKGADGERRRCFQASKIDPRSRERRRGDFDGIHCW